MHGRGVLESQGRLLRPARLQPRRHGAVAFGNAEQGAFLAHLGFQAGDALGIAEKSFGVLHGHVHRFGDLGIRELLLGRISDRRLRGIVQPQPGAAAQPQQHRDGQQRNAPAARDFRHGIRHFPDSIQCRSSHSMVEKQLQNMSIRAAPRTLGMKSGDADTSVSFDILPPFGDRTGVGPRGRTFRANYLTPTFPIAGLSVAATMSRAPPFNNQKRHFCLTLQISNGKLS